MTILFVVIPYVYKRGKFNRGLKKRKEQLDNLNDYQMFLVYSLYKELNHTGKLPIYDGEVIRMEQGLFFSKATHQYAIADMLNPIWPYMLQPWVTDYLDSNPELSEKYKRAFERIERKKQEKERNQERWY